MIGELIRLFRKEKGIGVIELSEKLGINRVSLFRVERGQRQPSEKTALAALNALGLSEENIYYIFVFNDLIKRGAISKNARNIEAEFFLKRLRAKDRDGKILQEYFIKAIRRKSNVSNAKR